MPRRVPLSFCFVLIAAVSPAVGQPRLIEIGGVHPTALVQSNPGAASADGTVVGGVAQTFNGNEAFRWTEATGLIILGDLPGGPVDAGVSSMSADGSILVGRGVTATGPAPYIWTEATGLQPHTAPRWGNLSSDGTYMAVPGARWSAAGRRRCRRTR
jgi:probable HAF family extracellular repeat protein